MIPLLQSRNLVVGPRTSKSVLQNSNTQNPANLFVNQVFNHQQVSSNNVPSILSNPNNAFNSQSFPLTDRASSINHHVALNVQVNRICEWFTTVKYYILFILSLFNTYGINIVGLLNISGACKRTS